MRFLRFNIRPLDQTIRFVIAIILGILITYGLLPDELLIIAWIIFWLALLTAGLRWSPTYALIAEIMKLFGMKEKRASGSKPPRYPAP